MSADAMSDFGRAGELAAGVPRTAGDTTLVEVVHGAGAYSRFAAEAAWQVRVHDNGRRAVVIDLAEGDGWFDAGSGGVVIEVRRGGTTIVAGEGAAAAVKGERDGRTIVVAVEGEVTLQPLGGERVVLAQQAAMLDRDGRVGQVVAVTAEQVATEPWIARNRALEPLPPVEESIAAEPEHEPVAAEAEPTEEPTDEPEPERAPVPAAIELDEHVEEHEPDPYQDAEPAVRRRWPRRVMAGLLLVAALALLLPRGGSDGGRTDEDAADVSSASIEATTTTEAPTTTAVPEPEPEPEAAPEPEAEPAPVEEEIARGEPAFRTELVACRRTDGQVTFTGRITNDGGVPVRYRLHVVFTGAGGAAVERQQHDVDVAAGATEAWQVTSSAGSRLAGGSCDLERVETAPPA